MLFEAAAVVGDVAEPEAEEGVLDVVAGPLLASVGGQRVASLDVAKVLEPCQLGGEARGRGLGLLGDLVVLGGAVRDRAQDRQVGARVADTLALAQQLPTPTHDQNRYGVSDAVLEDGALRVG